MRFFFFLLSLLLFLQGCAVFRWVGLAGGDEQPALSDEENLIKISKAIDVGINSYDVSALETVLDDNATRFANGAILRGKYNIVSTDKRDLASAKTSGVQPQCCTYPEAPMVFIDKKMASVSYPLKMQWPGQEGQIWYEGHITRIFKKIEDQWKLVHYQQSWQPAS